MGDAVAAPAARRTVVFIEYLRALAVLLVVWDHTVGEWLDESGRSWWPLVQVRHFIAEPLAIIQDFGFLGVAIFFLISGFIITHVATSETQSGFALRRFFRIYPPVIATVGVAYLTIWFENAIHLGGATFAYPSAGQGIAAMSLANYLFQPQNVVIGVAWTLVIEMCFYTLMFLVHPLLTRAAALVSWTLLGVVALALWTCRDFGGSFFLLAVNLSYVPLLVLGQAIWLRWSHRVSTTHFLAISALAWIVFVWGLQRIQPGFLKPSNSYGVSELAAWGLFVVACLRNESLQRRRPVRWVAERSYSIYLLHGFVALTALQVLTPHLPYTVALLIALGLTAAASEAMYRLVERPSQRLGRSLSRRRRQTPARIAPAAAPATQAS